MPKDYGYFGKGSSGYAHYMQSFNENNGGGGHGGDYIIAAKYPTNHIGIGFIESTIEYIHIITFSRINDITNFQKYRLLIFITMFYLLLFYVNLP